MSTPLVSTHIAETFAPMSARRLLIFGGIALIAGGMLFGDIFAVFVLHPNGGQTGQALLAACEAASAGDPLAVKEIFQRIGGLLDDLKVTAKVSQNLHAELALRAVARERRNIGSRTAGIEELKAFLDEAGRM